MFGWFKRKIEPEPKADIRYSHPGVEEFNRRLHERQNPPPKDRFDEPWSPAKKGPLPNLRREFDMNRDPYYRRDLEAMEKTEKQRRDEQTGHGSNMVKLDKPFMSLRPPPEERGDVDRTKFANDWLKEQRDALKAMTPPDQIPRDPGPDHRYQPNEPSR